MKITPRIYADINQHTTPQLGAGMLELKQSRPKQTPLVGADTPIRFIFTENSCSHVFYKFSQISAKQLAACNVCVMRL